MRHLHALDHPATRDRARAVAAVRELLTAVGEDVDRPGLAKTPERVTDVIMELFAGIGVDPASAIGSPVALEEGELTGDLVGLTDLPFRSLCEHHLLPFHGRIDVHYVPRSHLAGVSRIARVVDVASRRPQLQERLGEQIAHAVATSLDARGVLVRIEATHGCLDRLEPHAAGTRVTTVATAGEFSAGMADLVLHGRRPDA